MKNKVDRRDLSQLRNEVDLLSLPLDRCEMAVHGESAFAFFRVEVQIGCAVAVAVEFIDLLVEIDTTYTLLTVLPSFLEIMSDRIDSSNSGNNYTSLHNNVNLFLYTVKTKLSFHQLLQQPDLLHTQLRLKQGMQQP